MHVGLEPAARGSAAAGMPLWLAARARRKQERFKAEEEASKTQAAALQHSWLHILRAAKTAALRSDVELLAAQHERDCAHRDASLRSMFDDLMAAEEQYRVALFNHMRQMDRLIELQVRAPQ